MTQQPDPRQELSEWWEKVSHQDMHEAMDKAAEYGSMDLAIMGKAMEGLFPGSEDLDTESRRRLGVEMAIAFYHLGKAARTFGAYVRGVVPSDDTWHDAVVYAMMVRRVRAVGGWPFQEDVPVPSRLPDGFVSEFQAEMARRYPSVQSMPTLNLRRDLEEDDQL